MYLKKHLVLVGNQWSCGGISKKSEEAESGGIHSSGIIHVLNISFKSSIIRIATDSIGTSFGKGKTQRWQSNVSPMSAKRQTCCCLLFQLHKTLLPSLHQELVP